MKLRTFGIRNYRSISAAPRMPVSQLTVLVGPNNEGKSNVLQALALALRLITRAAYRPATRGVAVRYRYDQPEHLNYDWSRDFPLELQHDQPDGTSQLELEFELDAADRQKFQETLQTNLTTNLRIRLHLGAADAKFEVVLQGPAKRALSTRMVQIADFLRGQLAIHYIPSQRTTALATQVVEDLLQVKLAEMEADGAYQQAVARLLQIQRPYLDQISAELSGAVSELLPDVRRVVVEADQQQRRLTLPRCKVRVDDGRETDLEFKGDGLKSLLCVALLRHNKAQRSGTKDQLLAIEEPESHLHPSAVHQLRKALLEISETNQVILTTHSPLLVNRSEVSQNLLVRGGKVAPAKSLAEVRAALGVATHDNLASAFLVLLVEGDSDKRVITRMLRETSRPLARALDEGVLVVEQIGGAGNIRSALTLYRGLLCNVHAFLDADQTGRAAIDGARAAGLIGEREFGLTLVPGQRDCELEDLIRVQVYAERVRTRFGVDLTQNLGRKRAQGWLGRARLLFEHDGRPWLEDTEAELKKVVAEAVEEIGHAALRPEAAGPINALVRDLEERLPK